VSSLTVAVAVAVKLRHTTATLLPHGIVLWELPEPLGAVLVVRLTPLGLAALLCSAKETLEVRLTTTQLARSTTSAAVEGLAVREALRHQAGTDRLVPEKPQH
jgi:hypothetical protein